MTSDPKTTLACAEFQAQLAELIGSGENVSQHPHLQTCELCRALLADLETIAEAARQLFPAVEVEPPDTLWNQIESKIKNEREDPVLKAKSGTGPEAEDDQEDSTPEPE